MKLHRPAYTGQSWTSERTRRFPVHDWNKATSLHPPYTAVTRVGGVVLWVEKPISRRGAWSRARDGVAWSIIEPATLHFSDNDPDDDDIGDRKNATTCQGMARRGRLGRPETRRTGGRVLKEVKTRRHGTVGLD
jgi:hypothetical protein